MPIGSIISGICCGKPVRILRFERVKVPYLNMPSSRRSAKTAPASSRRAFLEPFSQTETRRDSHQSIKVIPTSSSMYTGSPQA